MGNQLRLLIRLAHPLQPLVVMGTLSKRPLSEFGVDIKQRLEELRSGVGHRIDDIRDQVNVKSLGTGLDKVSSNTWLACAGASLLGSIVLKMLGRNHASLLVGQWVPAFLILSLYRRRAV